MKSRVSLWILTYAEFLLRLFSTTRRAFLPHVNGLLEFHNFFKILISVSKFQILISEAVFAKSEAGLFTCVHINKDIFLELFDPSPLPATISRSAAVLALAPTAIAAAAIVHEIVSRGGVTDQRSKDNLGSIRGDCYIQGVGYNGEEEVNQGRSPQIPFLFLLKGVNNRGKKSSEHIEWDCFTDVRVPVIFVVPKNKRERLLVVFYFHQNCHKKGKEVIRSEGDNWLHSANE